MTEVILDFLKSPANMRTNGIYKEIKWLHILDGETGALTSNYINISAFDNG